MDPIDPSGALTHALPSLAVALAALPAVATVAAAMTIGPLTAPARAWRVVGLATQFGLGAALLALGCAIAGAGSVHPWLRVDLPGAVVLLLVAFIGWVIARYSATAVRAEPGEAAYARWLAATLAGALTVVVSNHVALLALAWWFTSFSLHRLLRFYAHRPAARIAAHKKFLMARMADACLALACVLLWHSAGTMRLDELGAWAAKLPSLPLEASAAVLLFALAAILKCAQLPFHGWLIQVMEAPTPVSALLHAGVVNLGGFVLLRLAPLVALSPSAQALLVVVGTASAVLAALVMTTRISIKVSLAWSTCAQMGFMLMQCGLGLWEMALLHLVAHSLYKAHAFLGAGDTVQQVRVSRLLPGAEPSAPRQWLATCAGVLVVAVAAFAWKIDPLRDPALLAMGAIVSLALAPLLAGASGARGNPLLLLRAWATAFAVACIYFGLHTVLARWVAPGVPATQALWWIPALAFAALGVLQPLLASPTSALAQRLHPFFYGGLFLDEAVSRLLFRLSPPPRA